jgi:hypothetical protein
MQPAYRPHAKIRRNTPVSMVLVKEQKNKKGLFFLKKEKKGITPSVLLLFISAFSAP